MSIKDLVTGLEDRIDGMFQHEARDPVALREPVIKAIKHAEDLWSSPQTETQSSWFSESNGQVAFSPTLANGAPLTIDGQTTTFVPAVRFADYLQAMRRAVEAGVFDAEIEAGLTGSPNVSGLATVRMPDRREGTDEEIRQAQRAEAMRRDGRNPDGSIVQAVGARPGASLT